MEGSSDLTLIAIVAVGVAAHLAMALLSRRIHPLFLLAGAFLVLAPLSLATDLESVGTIKYVRLYVTVLAVLVGIVGYGLNPFRGASGALLVFVGFYFAGALWSAQPFWAMVYKGMFGLTLLTGLLVGHASRDTADLLRGLRWLGLVAGVAGIVAFYQYMHNPEESVHVGRLAVWGLNANTTGLTAAALLILCFQLALHERRRKWRAFALFVAAILAVVILGTGSRGSLLMAVVGCLLPALPLVPNPGRLTAAVLVATAIMLVAMTLVELQAIDRFTDFTNTREGMWRAGWRSFSRAPLLGHGWVATGRHATGNMMNIYLQTLAEVGLVGGAVLIAVLFAIARRARHLHRVLRWWPKPLANTTYLAAALVAAVLVHGMFESAALLGSTVNALLLGLGVGLIDRLPELAARQQVIGQRRVGWTAGRQVPARLQWIRAR